MRYFCVSALAVTSNISPLPLYTSSNVCNNALNH